MTEGILHVYHPKRNLNVFEHLPSSSLIPVSKRVPPKHVLLFIGGMFDTFNLPRYVNDIAALFPVYESQQWRVMHVQLSSNGRSWGIFDLDRDIEEIAICVEFLRGKLFGSDLDICLMGHSTGCQDIMRYLTAPNPLDSNPKRPKIQGAILQAPVSDRDAVLQKIEDGPKSKEAYEAALKIAAEATDRRNTLLPLNISKLLFGPVPVSVERFLSVASPESPENPSKEDFFSHDLKDSTLKATFGRIGRSRLLERRIPGDAEAILVLMSDSDEFARNSVNQKSLLARWKTFVREETGAMIHGDSAVILNAIHDVGGEDWPSQEARLVVLRKKILHYLRDVIGGVDHYANEIWHKDGDRVMALKIGDGRSIEDQVGVLKL